MNRPPLIAATLIGAFAACGAAAAAGAGWSLPLIRQPAIVALPVPATPPAPPPPAPGPPTPAVPPWVFFNPFVPGFVTMAPPVVVVTPPPRPPAMAPGSPRPQAPPAIAPASPLYFAPPVRPRDPSPTGDRVMVIRRSTH
jgi:hypothetical protein